MKGKSESTELQEYTLLEVKVHFLEELTWKICPNKSIAPIDYENKKNMQLLEEQILNKSMSSLR